MLSRRCQGRPGCSNFRRYGKATCAPLNDWLYKTLQAVHERVIPSDDEYTLVFDKLEILIALGYAYRGFLIGFQWVRLFTEMRIEIEFYKRSGNPSQNSMSSRHL